MFNESAVIEIVNNVFRAAIDAIRMFLRADATVGVIPSLVVTLTGGASMLYGLAEAIGGVLKMPCRVAPDARDCVVLGCSKVLMDPAGMKHLLSAS